MIIFELLEMFIPYLAKSNTVLFTMRIFLEFSMYMASPSPWWRAELEITDSSP
jgi:hypothetical protein